jgi:hypothetical protein
MHENVPFSIPSIRNTVPDKLKPWIMLIFVIVFQLSGGVYLVVMSEMVGSRSLMQEDIMMAGYASMTGMALVFPIMFRLKFRFTSKMSLLSCALVIIICNLICMHAHSVPVLVITCFIAGAFRMWATFECNSTIQLWITPKRDLSIFFCFIYLLIQACIQFSGLATIYTAFFAKWEYMYLLIIGLLCAVMLTILILFRTRSVVRKLPLYGIDWLGGLLWGMAALSFVFVCVYGEHFDWFESVYIRLASIAGLVILGLNIWRASFIRHPYIALKTWRFEVVFLTFSAYFIINTLLASSNIFERIYMESVLHYDSLNLISLNWVALVAIIAGSFFAYQTFSLRKWRYRTMNIIGLSAIICYLLIFYFLIDYNLPKESMILPVFLRIFGYIIIAISFQTAISRIPFQNFPQALSIQCFASAILGSAFGSAVLKLLLKTTMKENVMLLGSTLDNVNPITQQLPTGNLYGLLQQQALMVSMKEIYGWLILAGIFSLLTILIKESDIRPKYVMHPTYHAIRKLIIKTDFNK